MAFIPAVFAVNAFMEFQLPNNVFAGNSLWIRDQLGQPTAARLEQLCQILRDWWVAELRAAVSNEIALKRINARDMTVQNGVVLDYTTGLPILGTSNSPSMPANVTIAITLRTGFAGRTRRGRLFHIGLTEAQVLGNFILLALQSILETAYRRLRSQYLLPNSFEWVVCSRFSNGQPRQQALLTPITEVFLIDRRIDTQRRRLPGIGT